MGLQLQRFGRLPSIGTWDTNFPGIVLLHAMAISLFGNSEIGFRIVDFAAHLSISLLLFRLCTRWFSQTTAFTVAILACCYYLLALPEVGGQRDGFVSLTTLAATFLVYKYRDLERKDDRISVLQLTRVALIGCLLGFSFLIRPTYGALVPVFALALFFSAVKHRVGIVLLFLLGVVAPILAMLVPYFQVPHSLQEVYLSTVRFNIDVYGSSRYRMPFFRALIKRQEILANGLLLLFVGLFWFRRVRNGDRSALRAAFSEGSEKFDALFIGSILIAAKISIWSMGKFYLYHYEVLLIFTLVLVGAIVEHTSQGRGRYLPMFVILVSIATCYPWHLAHLFVGRILTGASSPAEGARDRYESFKDWGEAAEREFSDTLAKKLHPADHVEVFSMDPGLSWRSGAEMASRFTTALALGQQTPSGGFTPYQLAWRKEFVDSIKSVRPRFIVLGDGPDSLMSLLSLSPAKIARGIPEFDSILRVDYHKERSLHRWSLYERNEQNR